MTIRKGRKVKEWMLYCDTVNCVHVERFPQSDHQFIHITRWIKANGWRAHYVGDDRWRHTCPNCLDAMTEDYRRRLQA